MHLSSRRACNILPRRCPLLNGKARNFAQARVVADTLAGAGDHVIARSTRSRGQSRCFSETRQFKVDPASVQCFHGDVNESGGSFRVLGYWYLD